MYPSKGSNPYGQQQFGGGQQQYGQITGGAYGGAESGSRNALAARQASLMGAGANVNANSEAEINQFRAAQSSQGAQYGGPYAAVYGSSAFSTRPQVGGLSSKGPGSSTFQGRASYAAALAESSKYATGALGTSLAVTADDFTSSGRGFTQKGDQLSALKNPDYASIERRNYESQGSYIGRELQTDSARRYVDPGSLSHQQQPEIHDQIDQASLLRQQHILKAQPLQSGDLRHADYYSARDAPILQGSQEISTLGGRLDADSRALSLLGSTPYGGGQHAASILGVPPRRNIEDLMYPQGSSTTAYGVSLPPGRDYSVGKVLRSSLLDSDYQGSVLSRAHPSLGASIVDDRKDDIIAYRREIERDEERRRDLIREREKERDREERDRARDRERERERDRERERLRERRDKERERDRKRERTPPRASKDRRGTSVVREEKSSHRVSPRRPSPRKISPRRDSVHRHRSPVKEKKREYVCKVSPFSLVDNERDHLSLSKRYPRLAISPEFSKVLLNWPNETINLSLHTPVSFEHDFLEVDDKNEKKGSLPSDGSCDDGVKTVWNAKVILMSGISSDMLNEISSEKSNDDRLLHFNNILRFAILKKDRSFMAIGGPSDVKFDCDDHSVVYPSLVETAIRYVKEITQLDLQKCVNWNPLLEIHYHRAGKDGLFSRKEITVLFVPNLSECLPSLDQWRSQWHAYKKSVVEREKQLALSHDKKSVQKVEGAQDEKTKGKNVKDGSTSKSKIGDKTVKDTKKSEPRHDNVKDDESKSKKKLAEEKSSEPDSGAKPTMQKTEAVVDAETKGVKKDIASVSPKVGTVKKKIIKKVVKGKTAVKKESLVSSKESVSIAGQKLESNEVDKGTNVANAANEGLPSAEQTNAKASARKKIVRKVAVGSAKAKEDNAEESSEAQIVKKADIKLEASDDKEDVKKEHNGGSTAQDTTVKVTGRKKIIRKVIKRKVAVKKEVDASGSFEKSAGENIKGQTVKTETDAQNVTVPEPKVIEEGRSTVDNDKEKQNEQKIKDGKEEGDRKVHSSAANESKTEKGSSKNGSGDAKKKSYKSDGKDGKDGIKDEKEKKNNKDSKHDSAQKSLKESKGKESSEEPPNHPGLILKTKRHSGSKLRSTSLSLFGLLDYNDNDVEESTFELSLFAESLNEMLQYQMGCRLLSFLEKLYIRYIKKRNERKRQREENARKETKKDTENSTAKRLKVDDDKKVIKESIDPEKEDKSENKNDGNMDVDGAVAGKDKSPVDNKKVDEDKEDEEDEGDEEVEEVEEEVEEEEEEEEEDPEEIIEEEVEDMDEDKGNDSNNVIGQGEGTEKLAEVKAGVEKAGVEDKNDPSVEGKDKASSVSTKVDNEDKLEKKNSKNDSVIDKDLLLAFRFFDRNRVGYIKVEDLKCILHNLGKFLSHKEVKEIVQSAVSESNSVSDRISYMKLVKLTDL